MLKILTVALLPSLLIQGYFVKKNTLRLPEATGQRKGTTNVVPLVRPLSSVF